MPNAQVAEIVTETAENAEQYGLKLGVEARIIALSQTVSYGHELSDAITPLQAGLGWIVKSAMTVILPEIGIAAWHSG